MTTAPAIPTIPGQVVAVDMGSQVNPTWYAYFVGLKKLYDFVATLQPLDDLQAALDLKSNIIRDGANIAATAYTFALTDAGGYRRFIAATAVTVTVPPNSSVAFPVWTQIDGIQANAGQVTFVPGAGVTIYSVSAVKKLANPFSAFTLVKVGTNEWDLVGGLDV